MGGPDASAFNHEVERLQDEVNRLNEVVDEKLDRLQDADFGAVRLRQQLEEERARVVAVEDEIARLLRKEDRRTRRLEKLCCQKCHTKVGFHMFTQMAEEDERYVFAFSQMKAC